ncbi:MAG: 3-oxoacyl-ACP synthase III family protein, partial [Candidatus Aminicenantales bacterium]
MSLRTVITGTGHYVPPKVVSNFDLEKIMNTTDDWIVQRSGIRTRHYAEDGVGSKAMGLEAARLALADAKCAPQELDFIIAATLSPDQYFPGIGVQIQSELGCRTIGALDVRAQCSGFLFALSVADQYIRTGTYKRILVVASEVQSHNLDYSDEGRDMAVLFGDGAGAVVCEPSPDGSGHAILSTHLFGDGKFAKVLSMETPNSAKSPTFTAETFEKKLYYPRMDGKRVFINAVERMPEAVRTALAA